MNFTSLQVFATHKENLLRWNEIREPSPFKFGV